MSQSSIKTLNDQQKNTTLDLTQIEVTEKDVLAIWIILSNNLNNLKSKITLFESGRFLYIFLKYNMLLITHAHDMSISYREIKM